LVRNLKSKFNWSVKRAHLGFWQIACIDLQAYVDIFGLQEAAKMYHSPASNREIEVFFRDLDLIDFRARL